MPNEVPLEVPTEGSRRGFAGDGILLAAQAVSKRYGALEALRDVDFDVRRGEVHALLGANGAGKSTLVALLSGARKPDRGHIVIQGKRSQGLSPEDAQGAGIRIIHQERQLCLHLSVAENIHLASLPVKRFGILDIAAMRRQAAETLSALGIGLDVDRPAGQLTRGEQQVVEIARAIRAESRVLLMDEPTAALGHSEAENLLQLVDRLRSRGTGIVYISHDLGEAIRIADRVTVLRDGRSLGTYEARECPIDRLAQLMVGHVKRSARPRSRHQDCIPLLEVRGLRSEGVEDVSFTLHKGEVLGVTGLLGSGHIELALTLFGARPIRSGVIRIRGEETAFRDPAAACEAGLGFVPPDRKTQGLLRDLSIAGNATLPLTARRRKFVTSRSWTMRRARAALDPLAVKAPTLEAPVFSLSGGNQQKVVFGKWHNAEIDILVLAEPTSGIDIKAKEDLIGVVGRLVESGTGVLVASTDFSEVERFASRALVMRKGRVTAEVSGENLTAERLGEIASA